MTTHLSWLISSTASQLGSLPSEDPPTLPITIDQLTGWSLLHRKHQDFIPILSGPDSASTFSLLAGENPRTPAYLICSSLTWTEISSRTDVGLLPSFVVREEEWCSSTSNASTSSRSSTLLNEPPQGSTERRWSLSKIRVPAAFCELLGRWTDSVHKSNADVTQDSATTSPV